ncbi:Ubiquitin carboxyl-terminal hydrolase 48 [Globomyces sp. JEL0801]|nr:Ubiquitin carboxyl-terminal hydrolase 48 [Globomyces sp. JEL0801]
MRSVHTIDASIWNELSVLWINRNPEEEANTLAKLANSIQFAEYRKHKHPSTITDLRKKKKPQTCNKSICISNPHCLKPWIITNWKDFNPDDSLPIIRTLSTGIANLGATCYLNSLIQIWFHNARFRNGIFKYQKTSKNVAYHLQEIFVRLQLSRKSFIDTQELVEAMKIDPSIQQDALEYIAVRLTFRFSKLLISLLDDLLLSENQQHISSLILDQYKGEYEYVTQCLKCEVKVSRKSRFYELEIGVTGKSKKLEDCIKESMCDEKLEGDNQYMCGTCQTKQDANRMVFLASLPTEEKQLPTEKDSDDFFYSNSAYLLVYELINDVSIEEVAIPDTFVEDIQRENEVFEKECKIRLEEVATVIESEKHEIEYFKELFKVWEVDCESSDAMYVSADSLLSKISNYTLKLCEDVSKDDKEDLTTSKIIDNSDLMCEHGKLNPIEICKSKRISIEGYNILTKDLGFDISPTLACQDFCQICFINTLVDQTEFYNHSIDIDIIKKQKKGGDRYLISKPWFTEWKKKVPNFPSESTPIPNSLDFNQDVYCIHGNRAVDFSKQIGVSTSVYQRLQIRFPSFVTILASDAACSKCSNQQSNVEKDSDEKENAAVLEELYALKRINFLSTWRKCTKMKPPQYPTCSIETHTFICTHNQLVCDLNLDVSKRKYVFVTELEWNILKTKYKVEGPDIQLTKNDDGALETVLATCNECRKDLMLQYTKTTISIKQKVSNLDSKTSKTNVVSKSRSTRQDDGFLVTIQPTLTVRGLKTLLEVKFKTPALYQTLYKSGIELTDNDCTMKDLKICPNDVLEIETFDQEDESNKFDEDNQIEVGFSGTVLVGNRFPIVVPVVDLSTSGNDGTATEESKEDIIPSVIMIKDGIENIEQLDNITPMDCVEPITMMKTNIKPEGTLITSLSSEQIDTSDLETKEKLKRNTDGQKQSINEDHEIEITEKGNNKRCRSNSPILPVSLNVDESIKRLKSEDIQETESLTSSSKQMRMLFASSPLSSIPDSPCIESDLELS